MGVNSVRCGPKDELALSERVKSLALFAGDLENYAICQDSIL